MNNHKAVIFDMDGVLIDTEMLWKDAEKEVFTSLGVFVSDQHTERTKSMTTAEVTRFWFERFPWKDKSLEVVEQMVIARVIELIDTEDCQISGVKHFIQRLKAKNFKIGLATNSPFQIIPKVLAKLNIESLFDAIASAEFEERGKPSPAVYRTTAAKLQVPTPNCFAIEDSYSGMIAAKAAGMRVVAFTNGNKALDYKMADYTIEDFEYFNINTFL